MKEIDRMYHHWDKYSEIGHLPQVTIEFGLEILAEMERCEPFQYTKSIYDDDYSRWCFIKKLYNEAFLRYPMAMQRAKIKYFGN